MQFIRLFKLRHNILGIGILEAYLIQDKKEEKLWEIKIMVPIQVHNNMHNYNVHTNIPMGKLLCKIIVPLPKSNVTRNNM